MNDEEGEETPTQHTDEMRRTGELSNVYRRAGQAPHSQTRHLAAHRNSRRYREEKLPFGILRPEGL